MIRLAVVGAIGSGKSHVAKKFGYPVFNADHEVTKLYKKSKKCYKQLKKVLPKHIVTFPIKKKEISKAIIDNSNNLKKIIKIVHPKVQFKMNDFIKKNKSKKFVVLDIPLFLENKMNKKNDILIFINAEKKEIDKRLKKKNFNPEILKKFKKLQLPIEYKKQQSHFIINNNFKNNLIKKNVKKILEKIL